MSLKLVIIYTPFASDWHSLLEEVGSKEVRWKYFSDQVETLLATHPEATEFQHGYRSVSRCALCKAAQRPAAYHDRSAVQLLVRISCRLLGITVDHVAFAFNFSDLPIGWKKRLFGFGFRQLKSLRVASQIEKSLYGNHFGIPEHRIEVRLWGMNVPRCIRGSSLPEPTLCFLRGRERARLCDHSGSSPDIV